MFAASIGAVMTAAAPKQVHLIEHHDNPGCYLHRLITGRRSAWTFDHWRAQRFASEDDALDTIIRSMDGKGRAVTRVIVEAV